MRDRNYRAVGEESREVAMPESAASHPHHHALGIGDQNIVESVVRRSIPCPAFDAPRSTVGDTLQRKGSLDAANALGWRRGGKHFRYRSALPCGARLRK